MAGTPTKYSQLTTDQQIIAENVCDELAADGLPSNAFSTMLAIAGAESAFNPFAKNGTHIGIFQIDSTGRGNVDLTDTRVNTAAAVTLYKAHGYTPWISDLPIRAKWGPLGADLAVGTAYGTKTYDHEGGNGTPSSIGGLVGDTVGDVTGATSAVGGAIVSAVSPLASVGQFLSDLMSVGLWKRIGIGALGVLLILIAVVFYLEDAPKRELTKAASKSGTESAAASASGAAMEGMGA